MLVALIGLVVIAIPWTEAKSSTQTVGVQIIMPPRPAAAATPLEEALQEPPAQAETSATPSGFQVQRTTTVVHEGSSMTVLVTDIPLI